MANERIKYIDNIKGFAILLVVMGHVIANFFDDFYALYAKDTNNQLVLWRFIYGFHMPLFMFCSGLFQPILTKDSKWRDLLNIIIKRFKVLMVPYFFSGMVLWYLSGRPSFYWFLLILFEFIAINLVISFLASRFQTSSNIIEGVLFLLTFLIIHFTMSRFQKYERLPLFDISHLGHYVYFTIGYLVAKYSLLDKVLKKHSYTIALILFTTFYMITNVYNITFAKGGIILNPIKPLAAILVVFFLFKYAENENRIMKCFNSLGRHSLEIYILHFFFLLQLPEIGKFIEQMGGGKNTFIFGVIISLFMAIVNILFCKLTYQIISKSGILSQLLLGRKNENCIA